MSDSADEVTVSKVLLWDPHGNTETCQFRIFVTDPAKPEFEGCDTSTINLIVWKIEFLETVHDLTLS